MKGRAEVKKVRKRCKNATKADPLIFRGTFVFFKTDNKNDAKQKETKMQTIRGLNIAFYMV